MFIIFCFCYVGFAGRSRSQQSSRENSVTRPIRETPQPPMQSREVSKGNDGKTKMQILDVFLTLV